MDSNDFAEKLAKSLTLGGLLRQREKLLRDVEFLERMLARGPSSKHTRRLADVRKQLGALEGAILVIDPRYRLPEITKDIRPPVPDPHTVLKLVEAMPWSTASEMALAHLRDLAWDTDDFGLVRLLTINITVTLNKLANDGDVISMRAEGKPGRWALPFHDPNGGAA